MSLATLSPENQIATKLKELGCAESNFAQISGVVGKTRLTQGLAGEKDFESYDARKMLEVIQEMFELRDLSPSPIDWRQVEAVRTSLEQRRHARKLLEDVTRVCNELYELRSAK